ncbi:hypothetical protein [Enterococcus olivae]
MKMENVALTEVGYIEKSISVEKLDNGNFKLITKCLPTRNKKQQTMELEFTRNGFSALIGTWMAMSKEESE